MIPYNLYENKNNYSNETIRKELNFKPYKYIRPKRNRPHLADMIVDNRKSEKVKAAIMKQLKEWFIGLLNFNAHIIYIIIRPYIIFMFFRSAWWAWSNSGNNKIRNILKRVNTKIDDWKGK